MEYRRGLTSLPPKFMCAGESFIKHYAQPSGQSFNSERGGRGTWHVCVCVSTCFWIGHCRRLSVKCKLSSCIQIDDGFERSDLFCLNMNPRRTNIPCPLEKAELCSIYLILAFIFHYQHDNAHWCGGWATTSPQSVF